MQIKHIVLLTFKPEATLEEINNVGKALAGLKSKIPGLLSFEWGPYSSEEGLNKDFNYGFEMIFSDANARDVYLDHKDHNEVKAQVQAILTSFPGGVIAFDYQIETPPLTPRSECERLSQLIHDEDLTQSMLEQVALRLAALQSVAKATVEKTTQLEEKITEKLQGFTPQLQN